MYYLFLNCLGTFHALTAIDIGCDLPYALTALLYVFISNIYVIFYLHVQYIWFGLNLLICT